MYPGFLLCLVGWGVLPGSVLSMMVLPFFVWCISRFQIAPEESALENKFGEAFYEYKKRVRRWM